MQAHATALVVNGSFEAPPADASWNSHPDGPYQIGSFSGWTSSGQSGHWRPNLGVSTFSSMPDGSQAGYTGDGLLGGTLTQDLHHTILAGETLTFQVSLGDRADLPAFGIVSSGRAELDANGSTIGAFNVNGNGSGTWATANFFFPAASLNTYVGENLSIVLSSLDGQQMSFDNISVTSSAVPEPASLAALGLGVVALIKRRRK